MKVIAIRHGETDLNKKHIVAGQRIDSPLNIEGKREAREAARVLKKENPSALYSSPLRRTKETAVILSETLALNVMFDNRLKERDVGELSGLPYDEVTKKAGLESFDGDTYDFQPFGGESSEDVVVRVQAFLDDILAKHKKDPAVLVVTHAHIVKMLYLLYSKPIAADSITNTCIHPFDVR